MNWKKKTAATACAAALCSMMAAPAFAATVSTNNGTAEVPIYATVVPAGATDVISVVMPAQIPLNIYLTADGKVDFGANKTVPVTVQVKNLPVSTKDVKVTLDSVTDTGNLMAQVGLAINEKDLSTSARGTELLASVTPGSEGSLTLKASADASATMNLNGTYTVSTVLKATAI